MNRSLTNVLFGGIAPVAQTPGQEIKGQITKTTVEETVEAMANAESVIIVRLLALPHLYLSSGSRLAHVL